MRKYFALLVVAIMSTTLLSGCLRKVQTTTADYDVAVVHTATSKEKSCIAIYDNLGNQQNKVNLNVGGINLANFYKSAISVDEMVYFTMPVLGNKSQDFIIEVNKNDLSHRKINNLNKRGITSFDVNSNYAFLSISDLENSTVTKVDLNNPQNSTQINVEGSSKLTFLEGETLYLVNNVGEHNTVICEINASDLTITNQTILENATFITDAIFVDNHMYLLINRDGNDKLTNQLVKMNLESKEIDIIDLPFQNLSKLYHKDTYLYIIENSYIGENTQNQIARFNIDTQEVDVFKTNNNHLATDFKNNKLYSTDGNNVYIYDLSDFQLLNQFDLSEEKDMQVVSIFAK